MSRERAEQMAVVIAEFRRRDDYKGTFDEALDVYWEEAFAACQRFRPMMDDYR